MSKAQEWSARIARMKVSGLTAKAFAQQEGVNPHTLEWWRRQLRLREEEIGAPRPRFVAVEIAQDAPGVSSRQAAQCRRRQEARIGIGGPTGLDDGAPTGDLATGQGLLIGGTRLRGVEVAASTPHRQTRGLYPDRRVGCGPASGLPARSRPDD